MTAFVPAPGLSRSGSRSPDSVRAGGIPRRLGYLSGALRVSTRVYAEAGGPRSHVLGIMGAYEQLGWAVQPFIVGDRMFGHLTKSTGTAVRDTMVSVLAADLVRLLLRGYSARQAWRELGGKVDWVYERFATFQSLGARFRKNGIPWVLETQGTFYDEAKLDRNALVLRGLAKKLELQAYRECDILVCVSEALRDMVIRAACLPPNKVVVVPNGVDTAFFDPSRYPPREEKQGLTIVYIGSLIAWQGLGLLLRAISRVQGSTERPIKLIVAGDGPMRRPWESLARDLKLTEMVHFLGRVPRNDVPGLIAQGDLGFAGHLPMRGGPLYHSPLKLYEYLAMERPALSSATEDASKVLRDGHTGFLFAAGDQAGLESALIRAISCGEGLHDMGRHARSLVIREHSWVARVTRLIELVEARISRERLC